jgi:predicted metal-dependent phosphoesterase TrpH
VSFRCDFHVHSTASDGTLSPAALVDEASKQQLDAFALTDHDTTAGVGQAVARGREVGVEVLAGIELSVSENGGREEMHILGLGIDPDSPRLGSRITELIRQREERGARIAERLRELGVELDFESVRRAAGSAASIGRPHVALALLQAGVCSDVEEAFRRFLRRGRPAYVARAGLGAREAIDLIHAAGGLASLAHPKRSTGVDQPGGLDAFVERLVALGLDGLEVEHPSHTPGLRRRLRRLARRFDLVATGGSDFHGETSPGVELGRGRNNVKLGRAAYDAVQARLAALG